MAGQADWDPLKELMTVQKRMNKLFESALARTDFETHEEVDTWTPVCDVYEASDKMVLCLELPGLEQSQIDLTIDGDDLVVAGERVIDRETPEEQFHRVERSYGKFTRRFHLPSSVDRESVEASYRDGVLRVTLPNHSERQARAIKLEIQ